VDWLTKADGFVERPQIGEGTILADQIGDERVIVGRSERWSAASSPR